MRILITGDRNYKDREMVFGVIGAVMGRVPATEDITIIDGMAKGADQLASEFGSMLDGVFHERYPADWDKHGKAAGHIRNKEMLDSGADVVIAFKDNFNHALDKGGTENMVKIAMAAGMPVILVGELNHTPVVKIPLKVTGL